jgi:hypothetical protein
MPGSATDCADGKFQIVKPVCPKEAAVIAKRLIAHFPQTFGKFVQFAGSAKNGRRNARNPPFSLLRRAGRRDIYALDLPARIACAKAPKATTRT